MTDRVVTAVMALGLLQMASLVSAAALPVIN